MANMRVIVTNIAAITAAQASVRPRKPSTEISSPPAKAITR